MHSVRRASILEKHPDVKKLAGPEWRSKYICGGVAAAHFGVSCVAHTLEWPAYLAVVYVVGATMTQALFLGIHELTHNLFFHAPWCNQAFAILANLPLGIPFAVDFRRYHMLHHTQLGDPAMDTDLPSPLEQRWFGTTFGKFIWCMFQIVAYAVRPIIVKPLPVTMWHLIQWAVHVGTQCLVYHWWGPHPLRYQVLCLVVAGGLHPCAGHFLSEHYTFDGQETTSYYGPLNMLTWNVGYHNEHHDFPRVPWSRLATLKATAPEYYDTLPVCNSWCGVIWRYIFDNRMGPHSRKINE